MKDSRDEAKSLLMPQCFQWFSWSNRGTAFPLAVTHGKINWIIIRKRDALPGKLCGKSLGSNPCAVESVNHLFILYNICGNKCPSVEAFPQIVLQYPESLHCGHCWNRVGIRLLTLACGALFKSSYIYFCILFFLAVGFVLFAARFNTYRK